MAANSVTICAPGMESTRASGEPLVALGPQWGGLPVNQYPILAEGEMGPAHVATPMLLMATRGQGKRWYRYHGRTLELDTLPDSLELYGSDFQREYARWEGQAGTSIGVHLSPQVVQRLVPQAGDFDIRTTHCLHDPKLQWLVQELFDEAQRGAPEGPLYAEGLSCTLIGRLHQHYGRRDRPERASGQLSGASRQRVIDYIEAHLGEALSVTELARQAGLTPPHFSRCFKASFGVTPHRYVQQRRIATASHWLNATDRPVAEIALELGFSSQSHFTQVFRQHTGTTPAAARFS